MKDKKDLKELEKKIENLEKGDLSGDEAAALIDESVRLLAAQGG